MDVKRKQGYIFALVAVFIWTGFILVSRKGGISSLHFTDMIAIRYGICSILLLPLWWFKFRFNVLKPRFLIVGLTGGLAYALCAFQGFAAAPASHAAVLLPGTMPMLIIVFSVLINRERAIRTQWFGVAAISLGVILLGGPAVLGSEQYQAGHRWLLLAAFFWSLFSVSVKRWQITPWQAIISLALVSSFFYLPAYWLLKPGNLGAAQPGDIILQAIYQGVLATIVQMYCYVNAVRLIGPTLMGSMMALVPLFAGLLSLWVFSEPLTLNLAIAVVLVSFGCWLTNYRGKIFKRRASSLT